MAPQIVNNTSQFHYYAIIVAGGTGARMQNATPKQFLLLNGLPVIMHTINAFAKSRYQPAIIIVLPKQFHTEWKSLCAQHHFITSHALAEGGETRFASVKNALRLIEDENAVVAIHDAVRPLIGRKVIENSYELAAEKGNAVAAVKSRDSVREFTGAVSKHLDRDKIYLVQTPQTFKLSVLKKAYTQNYNERFTDDASVAEAAGEKINIIPGNYTNIKITYPEDLIIAEAVQKKLPV